MAILLECSALRRQRSFVSSVSICTDKKTHFRSELHALFPQIEEVLGKFLSKKTTASTPMRPFFVPPNDKTSTPRSRVAWRRVCPSATAAFEMRAPSMWKIEIAFVRELCERADFVGLIDGASLRRLGDRNDLRLHVMLVADAVVGMADEIDGEFAVERAQRDEFRSSVSFGSAALVGINVRHLGTDHGFIRTGKSLQTQDVGAVPLKTKKTAMPSPKCSSNFTTAEAVKGSSP